MPSVEQTVETYQELAQWYGQQGQAQMRDRFLVLAADTMFAAGRREEAERLRTRLLQANPHHLFKPFASLGEAMKSTDVKNYVDGLRRSYGPDKAIQLLESIRSGKEDKSVGTAGWAEPAAPRPSTKSTAPPPPDAPCVLRFQDEREPGSKDPFPRPADSSRPTPADVSRPHGDQGRELSTPIPLARPSGPATPSRHTAPLWPEPHPPSPWRTEPVDQEPMETSAGAWVATLLFWLLLCSGIALAIFTIGGPFLPI
jgi:hypothetical protein